VVVKLGVVNDAPVAIDAPPVEAVYQFAVPVVQVAPKVTEPVPQVVAGVTVGAVPPEFTVAVTAVLDDSQPASVLQLT
jgi:hypothetical protein